MSNDTQAVTDAKLKQSQDKIDAVLNNGSVAPWEREDQTDTPDVEAPSQGETGIIAAPNNESALITENTEETAGQFAYGETLDFDMSELKIPFLRLASGMTPEVKERKANEGQWLLSGHEPVDSVEFVVTGVTRFREYRDSVTQETYCRSGDGVIGKGAPGGICAKCPLAQWGERDPKTGKGTPPACNAGFSYTIYSLTHQQPAILSLRKTAIAAAKTINTMIHLRKVKNFVVVMGHKDMPSPVGRSTYPVPDTVARKITETERAEVEESLLPGGDI
jgi:hypothetical protein